MKQPFEPSRNHAVRRWLAVRERRRIDQAENRIDMLVAGNGAKPSLQAVE